MKIVVQTPSGESLDFEADATDPIAALKCLIESVKPDLGAATSLRLTLKGTELTDETASLSDVKYQEGDVLIVGGADTPAVPDMGPIRLSEAPPPGKGAGKGADRPGDVPTAGFQAVRIVVSKCTNENSNGVFLPAKPYAGKPVWYKAPSAPSEEPSPPAEEKAEDDKEAGDDKEPQSKAAKSEGSGYSGREVPKSKDCGERVIYFSERTEKWFIGDALEEGGFTFAPAPGKLSMPRLEGWHNGTVLVFESDGSTEGLDAPAAMRELEKLTKVDPWADQEICYVTMLKVLGNIANNPTEAKFFSLKTTNAAIQNKILRHDGARGFLLAVGFREEGEALVLPLDRSANGKMAHEIISGFATEAAYANIRKERHAAAAVAMKEEAERKKYERKPQAQSGGGGGGGGSMGKGGGPMRGGGG